VTAVQIFGIIAMNVAMDISVRRKSNFIDQVTGIWGAIITMIDTVIDLQLIVTVGMIEDEILTGIIKHVMTEMVIDVEREIPWIDHVEEIADS
jgi:hypothetical protein